MIFQSNTQHGHIFVPSSKMNSFDETLVIAAREGKLQKVEYLVHEKGYDINSTSYKNKVKIPGHTTTKSQENFWRANKKDVIKQFFKSKLQCRL